MQLPYSCHKLHGLRPQRAIDVHGRPAVFLEIVQLPDRHLHPKHFLQAESLGAELDTIHIIFLGPSALELHRHRLGDSSPWREVKLHEVAFAYQTPLQRAHCHAVFLTEEPPRLMVFRIDSLVQHFPLGGKAIFLPDLLDMDKGILTFTKKYVLER
jgi:hypothetical protein